MISLVVLLLYPALGIFKEETKKEKKKTHYSATRSVSPSLIIWHQQNSPFSEHNTATTHALAVVRWITQESVIIREGVRKEGDVFVTMYSCTEHDPMKGTKTALKGTDVYWRRLSPTLLSPMPSAGIRRQPQSRFLFVSFRRERVWTRVNKAETGMGRRKS